MAGLLSLTPFFQLTRENDSREHEKGEIPCSFAVQLQQEMDDLDEPQVDLEVIRESRLERTREVMKVIP